VWRLPAALLGEAALTLQDLERKALEGNPAIAQAGSRVEAAAGRALQAGLWPNPTIGANGEHVSRVTGGWALGGFVEQRIVTAGKLRLDRQIAREEQALEVAHRSAERQRLLNTVRALYYLTLGDQMLPRVRGDLAALAARAVAVSRELSNVGQADQSDVLAAETEAERIALELTNAQTARERTWRQIAAVGERRAARAGGARRRPRGVSEARRGEGAREDRPREPGTGGGGDASPAVGAAGAARGGGEDTGSFRARRDPQ
jgi:cobalt-zinc-cadmium efflux system outer membrane protein